MPIELIIAIGVTASIASILGGVIGLVSKLASRDEDLKARRENR